MRRVVGSLLMVVVLFVAAGCGGDGGRADRDPSPGATPSPTDGIGIPASETPGTPTHPPGKRPVTVKLTRTGGIAGVHDTVEVTPRGAWSYTGSAGRERGHLTDQQVSKLQALALDERLRSEAKRTQTPHCADGFQYTLRAGAVSVTAVDCGRFADRPAFSALVDYVNQVTPM